MNRVQAHNEEMNMNEAKQSQPAKRLLLRKHHDITAFASTDSARFVLNGVNYNGPKKLLEATDGSICIRVPVEETDEFPPVPKLDDLPETNGQSCDIPMKPFLKALKSIPNSRLPILESVRLDVEAPNKNCQSAQFHLTTNDLDTVSTISGRAIDGTYPDIDKVVPTDEPKLAIVLSADRLLKIAQYASKHGTHEHPVKFLFTDELSPVRFSIRLEDGQESVGVLMPMRMS